MGHWAFFSYARADGAAAAKLHAALDRYRTPGDLVGSDGAHGPVPKTFHPVFRDASDLSGGGHLTAKIEAALASSNCLVVLCSPAAATSPWVNRECETFLAQYKAARIFPVIAPGLPAAGDRDEDFEETFFPPALRGKGFLAADLRETIAPSGKPVGDGEENGRLKLIAGLLGVPLDALVKREQRRQRRLVAMLGAAALVFAGVAAAAVWQTVVANEQRVRAVAGETLARQRAEAEAKARAEAEQNAREREEQRQLAGRNAEQARIQELAAKANAREASAQRDQARNSLARIFAERAWEAIGRENYLLAARYALAGWRAAPANEREYRNALGRILHDANERRLVFEGEGGFSPDGALYFARAEGVAVRIGEVATGREFPSIHPELTAHSSLREELIFSPVGRWLATRSVQGGLTIWSIANGEAVARLRGPPAVPATYEDDGRVVSDSFGRPVMAFGPTGARLFAAFGDGSLRVWERSRECPAGWCEIAVFATAQGRVWTMAAFSPDGERILALVPEASASQANSLYIFEPDAGVSIGPRLHEDRISFAAFSPDGATILTLMRGAMVRSWDAASGRLLQSQRLDGVGEDYSPFTVAMSPDGARLLAADYGYDDTNVAQVAHIWDVASGREVAALRHRDRIDSAAFDPAGEHVVTGAVNGDVGVWEAASGHRISALRGHEIGVLSVRFSPDRRRILTAGDGSGRIWPAPFGRELAVMAQDAEGTPSREAAGYSEPAVAFSPDGRRLLVSSRNATVRILDAGDGRELMRLDGGEHGLSQAAFSEGGARILAVSAWDGAVHVFEASTGRAVSVLGDDLGPRSVAISSDGAHVVTGHSGDESVRIWDAATGREISVLGRHGNAVVSVAFSRDGSRVLSASHDGTARVWDVASGRELFATAPEGYLATAAFSLDGRRIVTGTWDGTAKVWDIAAGVQVVTLRGHGWENVIRSVAFSPEGHYVLTAAEDQTARLWDAASGREIASFSHAGVASAAFHPDGARIATAGFDGTVRLWDVSRLTQPMAELARAGCTQFLRSEARRFTEEEVASDPLIREVWLRGHSEDRDVCEGMAGVPPLRERAR